MAKKLFLCPGTVQSVLCSSLYKRRLQNMSRCRKPCLKGSSDTETPTGLMTSPSNIIQILLLGPIHCLNFQELSDSQPLSPLSLNCMVDLTVGFEHWNLPVFVPGPNLPGFLSFGCVVWLYGRPQPRGLVRCDHTISICRIMPSFMAEHWEYSMTFS